MSVGSPILSTLSDVYGEPRYDIPPEMVAALDRRLRSARSG